MQECDPPRNSWPAESTRPLLVGGNYVNVWTSSDDGRFIVTEFSPNPSYDTSLGRWLTADLNSDGQADLIHITGLSYVHPWINSGAGSFEVGYFEPLASAAIGSRVQ